jgi:putative ABC transport system permease protein
VNEAFARQFVQRGSAIGRRVKLGTPEAKLPWLTIVGIVGNVSQPTLYMGYESGPAIYRPLRQDPIGGLSIYVRTETKISGIAPEISRVLAAVDSNLPAPALQTADQSLAEFTSEPRFRAQLFGVFAGLALLLAAVGIYGVLAQLVVQRTHEIGIRMALGADRGNVLRLIMGEGLKIVSLGIVVGIVGSLLLTRLLSSMLYGVGTTDPWTFAGVSLLLGLVALFACYIPAHRAMRTDPLASLRCE